MNLIDRVRAGIHAATVPVLMAEDVSKAMPAMDHPVARGTSVAELAPMSLGPNAPMVAGVIPDPGGLPQSASFVDMLRYQFTYGANYSLTPRRTEKSPFALLRQMAEFSHIRTCIEARKDQMTSLTFDVRPKDQKDQSISPERLAKVRAFFDKPDRKRTWHIWLRLLIEEVLVVDALSIFKRKTYGGELYALDIVDGSTILPMVDGRGDIPEPPSVAYRQIIFGHPIQGGDCTLNDLMYRPRVVRTHTLYGMSPTEWVLLAINAAINRDMYNLTYYTEGNVPETVMDAPGNWTVDQIKEFEQLLNLKFAGALGERRKLKVLGSGMAASLKRLKEPDFTGDYDEWLLKVICAAFAVPPQELGFTADVNKATGQSQENVVYRRGVKPLANFIQDIINEVIATDLKEPGIESVLTGGEVEDKYKQAQTDEIYIRNGVTSPDEVAQRMGLPPSGLGRMIVVGTGPLFADELVNQTSAAEVAGAASGASGDQSAEGAAVEQELKKYRSVAINRVKQGKAPKTFTSTVLPETVIKDIHTGLLECETVGEVAQLFDETMDTVQKVRGIVRQKTQLQKKLRVKVAAFFEKQQAAFIKHLQPTVDALEK